MEIGFHHINISGNNEPPYTHGETSITDMRGVVRAEDAFIARIAQIACAQL